jgi:hypothetical protein
MHLCELLGHSCSAPFQELLDSRSHGEVDDITDPLMDWFKLKIASISVYYQRSAAYALVFSSKKMFLLGVNFVFIIQWNLVYS